MKESLENKQDQNIGKIKEYQKMKNISELCKSAKGGFKAETAPIERLSEEQVRKLAQELETHQIELEMQNAELRKAELQIEESRQKYLDLYDFAPVGYFTIQEKGTILGANLTGALMLGMDRSLLIKKPLLKFVVREDKDIFYLHIRKVIKTKKPEMCELRMLNNNDNTQFHVQLKSNIVLDRDDNVCRVIISDITERRKKDDQIHKLSHALGFSPTTIVITDKKGRIEYVNPKFSQLTGYSPEEVIGKNPSILKSGKTPPALYQELWETIENGNEWRGEFCNRKKNGELYWESASISPVKNDKGVITNFIAVKEDITGRKKMKELLIRSEKLNSLGTITAGIAHEFNNILGIILSSAEVLDGGIDDERALKRGLGDIIKACDDGSVIVKRMRIFSDVEENQSDYILTDIGHIIKEAIAFTMPRWKNMAQASGIKFHIDTEDMEETPEILCNPTELREVFINLINNAMDAMPDGGCISFVTTSNQNNVFTNVSDTGIGMTEDVKKKVFDPFFSTRKPQGTGLGMSITYSIIKKHGGNIDVESEAGKGTTFYLSIPISNKVIQRTVPPELGSEIISKKLRILVVDDEKRMCMMLNAFFSKGGHIVKTADNGEKAIELVRKEDFDLVLCDLAMPDIDGYDIIKALNRMANRPKIGIITGWIDELTRLEEEDLKINFVINKPFNFLELTKLINEQTKDFSN